MKKRLVYIVLFILISSASFAQKKSKVFNAEGDNAIYKALKDISRRLNYNDNANNYFSTNRKQNWNITTQ